MKHESMKRKKEYFATLQHCSLLSSLNGRRSLKKERNGVLSSYCTLSYTQLPRKAGLESYRAQAFRLLCSSACSARARESMCGRGRS